MGKKTGKKRKRRIKIVATTSHYNYEANWNGRTDGEADGQDHVLGQADALTKNWAS